MIVGDKNTIHQPLFATKKVILPPLPIKLGLVKQFIKALNRDGTGFRYLCTTLSGMNMEKIEAKVFNGLQIRQLMSDLHFASQIIPKESVA